MSKSTRIDHENENVFDRAPLKERRRAAGEALRALHLDDGQFASEGPEAKAKGGKVSDMVLFQLSHGLRRSLIEGHQFYVDQARRRLLSQFENIESEAEKASEEWLERNNNRFDPDRHDPSDFYEAASNAGIEFYGLLSDMRNQTWLSVVAGMFHEWDKQLRQWLVREIQNWHEGESFPRKIWLVDFVELMNFLESISWKIREAPYFQTLDACRVVVNVHKHGDGSSLDVLKEKYPEYLLDALNGLSVHLVGKDLRDHTDLQVTDEQFQAFSDAIAAFLTAVPENTSESQIENLPDWAEKAILKDRARNHQPSQG
jgi:hypothetical protein